MSANVIDSYFNFDDIHFGFEATPNRHDSFDSPQFIQITDYRRRVTFYSATIE